MPFTSKQVGAALGAAAGVALHPMLPGPKRPAGVTETYDIDPQAGRPSQTRGRALPAALQNTRPQGYQITPTAQLRSWPQGKPADAVHTQTHTGGFTPLAAPRKGEHILLAQDHPDNHPDKPGRRAMADYPNAPTAKKDLSGDFSYTEKFPFFEKTSGDNKPFTGHYTVQSIGPIAYAFKGNVINGKLSFSVRASHLASGGDLFINAINTLHNAGVAVHSVIGKWSDRFPFVVNANRFHETLRAMRADPQDDGPADMSRADCEAIAAASTYTGHMAKKYGLMPVRVTNNELHLGALFTHPLDFKLSQLGRLGPAFMAHIKHPPVVEIDWHEAKNIAAHTSEPSSQKPFFEYTVGGQRATLIPEGDHLSLRWPDQPDRGPQSAQRDATLLAGLLQSAQNHGFDVSEITLASGGSLLTNEGFKFLTEQLSMPEREAVNHLPITRAFKALGFEPRDFIFDHNIHALSVSYNKVDSAK